MEIYVHQLVIDLNFQNEDLDGYKLPLAGSAVHNNQTGKISWPPFPVWLFSKHALIALFQIQNAEACLVLNLPVPVFYPMHFTIYISKNHLCK